MSPLRCLVMMPFRADFDAVYQSVRAALTDAVPGEQIDCYWLKDVQAAGRITDDILDGLNTSALCIADITGSNPNVMWETGYAMALGKPTILIGQDVESLPFDLKVHRVLRYEPDNLTMLSVNLAEAARQTLARYDIRGAQSPPPSPSKNSQVIAVTGSAVADPARVHRRVETMLQPYLDLQARWYCGSNGVVDESVLNLLLANNQCVVIVGYHRYDYSTQILTLIKQGRVSFVDASVESMPRGLAGPNARDVLFANQADLVIVFWNGKSQGTAMAVDYFQRSARNLLLSFI